MKKTKVAIIYDFDKTLSPKDMQEFNLYKELGFEKPSQLWVESDKIGSRYQMDRIIAYMLVIANRLPFLSKEKLVEEGKYIKLFEGVKDWFKRINDYGLARNIEIEHYIISSGLKLMIEGTSIAKEFKRIYACDYAFDKDRIWPSRVVNYTSKTQYIFRINKGVLDWNNDSDLNSSTPETEKRIPFSRMIYIGDGFTDVPCMKIVSQYGGNTIAVYGTSEAKEKLAKALYDDKRATFMAKADYRKDSRIDKIVRHIIDNIEANIALETLK